MSTNKTSIMSLHNWAANDSFNYIELNENFTILDSHDHTGGSKGSQLQRGALTNGIINADLLDSGAVTEAKIDTGAISTTKLATNAVTKDKINFSNINELTSGALPSSPTSGTTVLYTNNIGSPAYVWQLVWTGSNWHFVGGSNLYHENSTAFTATAAIDTSYVWYGNPGRAVGVVDIPLPGTYLVQQRLLWEATTNTATGFFSSGLTLGGTPSTTSGQNTGTDISDSRNYSFYDEDLNSAHEASGFARITVPSNQASSSRKLRQSIRIISCSTGTSVQGDLYFTALSVTPVSILGNWSN